MYKVICVVGNRPQFVKQAMFDRALADLGGDAPLTSLTVNTGQHYDALMSDVFFQELGAQAPKYDLGIGSGPIIDQIGKMLGPLGQILKDEAPDAVMLYGDTNSTLAGALTAAHSGIPCIHVEGGERLYRRNQMPEEINRVATDHLADLLLTCSRKASRYLAREGMGPDRVIYVGDLMLDLFAANLPLVDARATVGPATWGLTPGGYMLATIHRVENTADRETLLGIFGALDEAPMPVLLPMHPRVKALLAKWEWAPKGSLRLTDPLGYFDFLAALRDAALVVSDSGGVTREALFAGKGCIIPQNRSAWIEPVEAGLSTVVGQDIDALRTALHAFRPDPELAQRVVALEFGDGKAAYNIVRETRNFLDRRKAADRVESAWHPLGHIDEIPPAQRSTDLGYAAYRALLGAFLAAGYGFGRFARPPAGTATCLLRHDIVLDLEKARDMARIEAGMGVKATYFMMPSSDHYNLASAANRALVQEILALGHDLGLHFDAAVYDDLTDVAAYQRRVGQEAALLSGLCEAEVTAVSFHRPAPLILEGDPALSGDLPHSHDRDLQAAADYVSDSGGRWEHGLPTDSEAFAARQPMHILVHPIWWAEAPVSPVETLLSLLDQRHRRDAKSFARNCRPFRIGYLQRDIAYDD